MLEDRQARTAPFLTLTCLIGFTAKTLLKCPNLRNYNPLPGSETPRSRLRIWVTSFYACLFGPEKVVRWKKPESKIFWNCSLKKQGTVWKVLYNLVPRYKLTSLWYPVVPGLNTASPKPGMALRWHPEIGREIKNKNVHNTSLTIINIMCRIQQCCNIFVDFEDVKMLLKLGADTYWYIKVQ
jgi:hypothetical protein